MALLLAQARNIPQAHAALKAGTVGALQVGGRRAARQDARHHRPRPHRRARGPAGHGVRHAARRLRPVRVPGPGPPDGRRAASPRRARGRLPTSSRIHLPKTPETVGLDRRRAARQGQAGHPHRERGPRRHHRRGGAGRRHRRGPGRRRRARRVRHRAVPPSRRCSSSTRSWSPRTSAPSTAEAQDKAGEHDRREGACSRWRGELRALRRERRRGRGLRDACGPSLPLAERLGRLFAGLCERAAEPARDRVPGRPRRRGHASPDAFRAQGHLRGRRRGARLVRERPPFRQGPGPRGARVLDDRCGRLPEPGDPARWRPRGLGDVGVGEARSGSSWSTITRSTCRSTRTC